MANPFAFCVVHLALVMTDQASEASRRRAFTLGARVRYLNAHDKGGRKDEALRRTCGSPILKGRFKTRRLLMKRLVL